MKTISKINDKEIEKRVNKMNYYNMNNFAEDCKRYAKAVKERRLIMSVINVSNTGMSRNIRVRELSKANAGAYCLNSFYALFKALGISLNKDGDATLRGCGMDMIFALNHSICTTLKALGVINKAEFEKLSRSEINRF